MSILTTTLLSYVPALPLSTASPRLADDNVLTRCASPSLFSFTTSESAPRRFFYQTLRLVDQEGRGRVGAGGSSGHREARLEEDVSLHFQGCQVSSKPLNSSIPPLPLSVVLGLSLTVVLPSLAEPLSSPCLLNFLRFFFLSFPLPSNLVDKSPRFGRASTSTNLYTIVNASPAVRSRKPGPGEKKSFVSLWDTNTWTLKKTRTVSQKPVTAFDVR